MTNKITAERAARAQLLALSGLPQKDIAVVLKCTTRTVRRYMQYEIPAESVEPLSKVDAVRHQELAQQMWNLAPRLLNYIEKMLEADELKPRDAIVATGMMIDRARMLSPREPKITETQQVQFIFRTPDTPKGPEAIEGTVEDTDVE